MDKLKELLDELKDIKYGWIDLVGNVHEKIDREKFESDYRLQIPNDIIKNGYAICWDMVEYERLFMIQNNISYKSIFISHNVDSKYRFHTLILCYFDDKIYWFENAFKNFKGIRVYENNIDCFKDIAYEFLIENDILKEGEFTFFDYDKPEYNISASEFVEHCMKGKEITLNK